MALRRASIFRSVSTFFGLTQEYRNSIYSQIHEIVFHGKGGYSWETVYNMPIWLRKFTFSKIKEWYDKESEAYENGSSSNSNSKEIAGPDISPSYSTKASK